MLAQIAETIPDQLWEQPGAVILVIIVILAAFGMFGWLLKQNASERKANSDFITGLIVNSLDSQRELSTVMSQQAQAMMNQGEAMNRQADAMQQLAHSLKSHEDLAAGRFQRNEADARARNEQLLNSISALGTTFLERRS